MNWTEEDLENGQSALSTTLEFQDFKEAWSFMNQVADLAEEMNHHPNWTNVYNRVTIVLSTHDKGNIITDRDRALASAIEALL